MIEQKANSETAKAVVAIVLFVLISRIVSLTIIGHPVSFAPMNALALFCGAYLGLTAAAYLLPLAAIVISDQVINLLFYGSTASNSALSGPFYPGWYWQYACYALFVGLGFLLQPNRSPLWLGATAVGSSILFFVISNFGVWFSAQLYPPTADGLIACYLMGLPFLKQAVGADLFYCALFFGSYQLLHHFERQRCRQQQAAA